MIGSDAFAAQDALAQIPDDKRVGFLKGLVVGHVVQICFTHAQLGCDPAQLAAIAFVADNTGFRMLGDHQAGNIAAVSDGAFGGGLNGHVRCHGCDTGRHQASGFFVFHQTHSAGTKWFQIRMVAEFGNFYAILLSSLQDARSGRTDYLFAVNGQSDGFQGKGSLVLNCENISFPHLYENKHVPEISQMEYWSNG